jgi:hypothetical protein
MKAALKKLATRFKTARYIGKPVRFAIAVYRIPRSRAQLISVMETLSPSLLETISKLNQRQHEIDRDLPVALRKLRREIGSLETRLDQELGGLENKLMQQISAEREKNRGIIANVDYLLKRFEFVRRELMFEMRYGCKRITPDGDQLEAGTKIIAADKLISARASELRINLGCGHLPLDGYLNVDLWELPGVDIIAEAGNLPFGPGEADEIFSAHLLERFPQEELRRRLLPYWKSLLKPGGLFRAVVPDAEAMIREYSAGRYPYEHMRQVFYGTQDCDGDFHHNMFIPSHMSALLAEAGFSDPKVIEAGRRNDICFEFEIAARCPI